MNIGRAAHTRVWLQTKTTTTSNVGQEVDTWSDVKKVSAERREESGGERIRANRVDSVQAVLWKIMTTEEVTSDWRIRTGGTEANPEYQDIEGVRVVRLFPREIEVQTLK